jgi:hypothetical protein
MGIFWNYAEQPQTPASMVQQFRAALAAPSVSGPELDRQAQALADEAAAPPPRAQGAQMNTGNLIIAIGIVAALIGAGIGTNAAGLGTSTTSLFGLATTAFGIVVGILTGEKPAAPDAGPAR